MESNDIEEKHFVPLIIGMIIGQIVTIVLPMVALFYTPVITILGFVFLFTGRPRLGRALLLGAFLILLIGLGLCFGLLYAFRGIWRQCERTSTVSFRDNGPCDSPPEW